MTSAAAVEMTSYGKGGNQTPVPSLPTALGNRFAIPTFPPHGDDDPTQNQHTERTTAAVASLPPFRLILQ
jgi:hypothetical protein